MNRSTTLITALVVGSSALVACGSDDATSDTADSIAPSEEVAADLPEGAVGTDVGVDQTIEWTEAVELIESGAIEYVEQSPDLAVLLISVDGATFIAEPPSDTALDEVLDQLDPETRAAVIVAES